MKVNIGIEISEHFFKMTVAALHGAHLKLSDVIIESTPSLNDDQIAVKFSEALKALKVKPGNVVLSLARNLATVRNLHLPSQDKKEVTQMIDLNVARIVPYKREEITFSSHFLGTDEMGYTKVILAIVNSNVLRRQSRILEKAGLLVDKISLSTYGTWEWVLNNYRVEINQTDLYLLLDVDFSFTDFIIFSAHNVFFTRSINVGANSVRESGDIGITKLLGEVKQSLITFYNEEINRKPANVFLGGAGIQPGLKNIIETELNMPVKVVPCPYPPEVLRSKGRTVPPDISLTGVSALTLKDSEDQIHFILPEIQIRKSLREQTRNLIILGTLFIYFFTGVFALLLGKISNQQGYLNRLNEECRAVEGDMKDLLAKLEKIDFIKSQLDLRRIPMAIFSELQKGMPNEITVTAVSMDEQNRVTVRGQTTQLSDVFKFINTLEKVSYFKNIETKSTRKKKVKERDMTEFEIVFSFKTQ